MTGLIGCIALAFTLAPQEVAIGLTILIMGAGFRIFRLGWARRLFQQHPKAQA